MTRKWPYLAALVCAGGVAAEEPVAAAVTVVTVAGHYNNAIGSSDAASEGTVNAELIRNRPALRTGELLEFVPGMIVTQHSGDGKANQYFLRGFNLDHGTDFATHVDGMPVNMRSHAHGQGYTDLGFLIPELVQRIDYKKGPYFASEGDFSSAGSARMRLADSLPNGTATLSVGENGYRRMVVTDSVATAGGNLVAGLEVHRNNGPWETPEDLRKYSATVRYVQGAGNDGYSVTAMAYRNTWNATDQVPLRAVEGGTLDRFGSIDASDGGVSSRYSLSWAMKKRGQDRLTEVDAYAVASALDLYSNFTYFLDNPDTGDQFRQSERRRMGGLNAAHSWTGTVNGLAMRNKVGVQARVDRLAPVGLYRSVRRETDETVREDRLTESSAGVYLENTIAWLPAFRSIAGVRYDAYRFRVDSNIEGNSGKASDAIASPKLSLVFGPWRKSELFINYGKGFHSNDARGTTQTRLVDGGAASPVTPLVATRGMELGARTEIVPGLQSSLALWRLDIDSELLFIGDAGDTEASRASRRRGIEWNNHLIATPWLLFDVDLAVSRARFAEPDPAGDRIPGSLGKVASFGATVTGLGRWSGGVQARYFGPRPLIEDGSMTSRSTALLYGRIGYALSSKTRLSLDVFNLLDRKASDVDYLYESRLRGEAAGVEDIHFHPVEPRSVRLTLAHNF
ncbi:TonB-dependent receptor [Massilia soli]|uniref:TonB-dependent receptor n=1 Tax=Massilia soli TaxID=2792854 RepID=A0ABS7SV70_9BURK|nr:TonB-dependent receptor [Massilia soli]MBZ2209832.1 TonB-dependent receptor [Massilia soli]